MTQPGSSSLQREMDAMLASHRLWKIHWWSGFWLGSTVAFGIWVLVDTVVPWLRR